MAIQDRLKRDRYGLYNITVPTRDELKETIQYTDRQIKYLLKKNDIYNKVKYIYFSTYTSHRYKDTYNNLISDYKLYCTHNQQSWSFIVTLLYKRFLYFYHNPQYYQHNFEVYAVSWYVSTLFQMRKAIMKQLVLQNKIPAIRDFNNPTTNGFYKLVKPMYYKHTIRRAMLIHDLFDSIKK